MIEGKQPVERERPSDIRGTVNRLFTYLAGYRPVLAALVIITLVAIAADIASPLMIEGSINAFNFSSGIRLDKKSFVMYTTILIVLYCTSGIMGYLHEIISSKLSLNLEKELRHNIVEKIIKSSVRETEFLNAGDLISRAMNDAKLAANAFSDSLLTMLSSVIVILGCIVIMMIKSRLLAMVAIITSFISVVVVGLLSGMLFPFFMARQKSLGLLSSHFEESLGNIRTCMANNRTGENIRLSREYSKEYYRTSLKAGILEGIMAPVMMLLANLSFLSILFTGTVLVIKGVIGLGTLQAFILYSRMLTEPLGELGDSFAMIFNSLASSERVFELCDLEDEPALIPGNDVSGESGSYIEFKNVSFSYRDDHEVLKGLDLKITRGEKIALVGFTGAGKTTLTNLLLRFYNDYTGHIIFDGQEIRSVNTKDLRSRIMIVPQEAVVMDGTIRDNIAYGSKDASLPEVIMAAKKTGLSDIIDKLPEGYDTVIKKEDGILSQGQVQLMCLTRAILREPEVLIMDEAVNSVDGVTEQMIINAMETSMESRTCIIIAHRLASITKADRILMLGNGTIIHSGSHTELMNDNNEYRQLFMAQFSGRET